MYKQDNIDINLKLISLQNEMIKHLEKIAIISEPGYEASLIVQNKDFTEETYKGKEQIFEYLKRYES